MFKSWWEIIPSSVFDSRDEALSQIRELIFPIKITTFPHNIIEKLNSFHKFGDWTAFERTLYFKSELDAVMARMLL